MNDFANTAGVPSMLTAAVVLDELAALGVSDIVCCPGSRSAPLAYASAALESSGRVRLHIRLDERGAGYFGLGIAKATGRAVVVVTTSGTAVANLAPSLAEARYARVPLVALTADRPATLVGCGANQTADQVGIFGTIPLMLSRISATDSAPQAWRAAVRRAVVTAEGRLTGLAGPVHINVELPVPLVGDPGPIPDGGSFRVDPIDPPRPVDLSGGPRSVIVAGDMSVAQGRWWSREAARTQVPLLGEPSSNARRGPAAISGYRHLLPGFSPMIERVVVAGHPTLSRSVTALLSRSDIEIIAVDASPRWPDPGWAVSAVFPRVRLAMGDPAWMRRWSAADERFRSMMDEEPTWSGQTVAATVLGNLTDADAVVLGASNPIRDADLAPIQDWSPQVYANRGLSGIDGVIATACGVAVGHAGPVVALVGDLSAVHDIASLALPVMEPGPDLRLVIADDHGGSLFSSLEFGQTEVRIGGADWFERLFAVEMDLDLAAVARGFGVPVTTVGDAGELAQALNAAAGASGIRVIHADLERHRRAEREQQLADWGLEAVQQSDLIVGT